VKHPLRENYGGNDLELQAFLNSKLDGSEWSASRGGRFVSRKSAFYVHWIGGHISSRADIDTTVERKRLALARTLCSAEIHVNPGLFKFIETVVYKQMILMWGIIYLLCYRIGNTYHKTFGVIL
jgi:hypothetical protein